MSSFVTYDSRAQARIERHAFLATPVKPVPARSAAFETAIVFGAFSVAAVAAFALVFLLA